MTTIAYRDGVMAADTVGFAHDGQCRLAGRLRKIWRLKDGRLVGCAGRVHAASTLLQYLETAIRPATLGDVTAIVALDRERLLVIDGDKGEISEREVTAPFYAIGSGSEAALGAMYAGASAEEAVRIAMLVDPWTGGDVDTERLG